MPRTVLLCFLLCTACGGGGGTATVASPVRLLADGFEIGSGANHADLVVAIDAAADQAPVLLQVEAELPSALVVDAAAPLASLQTLPTLRGELSADRYRIVCGDDRNRSAAPLRSGPLFHLRLAPSSPRQPGTYTVHLRNLMAARTDGSAATVEPAPTTVTVVVR